MKFKEIKQEVLRSIGNVSLGFLTSVLCNTLKIRRINSEGIDLLIAEKKNFILAFWHGAMLIPWYVHREQDMSALVSKSKDGTLLARLLEKWKYNVIRGSSNDGGRAALDAMINLAKKNESILLTPDGPRGPAQKFKAGAVVTSVKTGAPLILCGVHYNKKRSLNSWDQFCIPKLFSSVTVFYSDPFYAKAGLSRNEISKLILEYEEKLNMLQVEAGKIK